VIGDSSFFFFFNLLLLLLLVFFAVFVALVRRKRSVLSLSLFRFGFLVPMDTSPASTVNQYGRERKDFLTTNNGALVGVSCFVLIDCLSYLLSCTFSARSRFGS